MLDSVCTLNPDLLSPKRLMLFTILYVSGPKTEADLAKALGLSWGDIDSNIRRLTKKGYIEVRKVITIKGPRTLVSITEEGVREYRNLASVLHNLLETAAPKGERKTEIDELFLIYKDGRLLKHLTRRLRPDIDADILAGMLTAVQHFVKDAFRDESVSLQKMELGDLTVLIGKGQWLYLAVVISGEEIDPMRPQIENVILEIERECRDILENWDGRTDRTIQLTKYLKDLIAGKYI